MKTTYLTKKVLSNPGQLTTLALNTHRKVRGKARKIVAKLNEPDKLRVKYNQLERENSFLKENLTSQYSTYLRAHKATSSQYELMLKKMQEHMEQQDIRHDEACQTLENQLRQLSSDLTEEQKAHQEKERRGIYRIGSAIESASLHPLSKNPMLIFIKIDGNYSAHPSANTGSSPYRHLISDIQSLLNSQERFPSILNSKKEEVYAKRTIKGIKVRMYSNNNAVVAYFPLKIKEAKKTSPQKSLNPNTNLETA